MAPFGNEETYGVEWRCPRCDDHMLDLCPLGPLVPTRESCLNCGTNFSELNDFASCPACDMTRLEAVDFFGLDPAPTDPVERAGKLFDRGVIRRAIATLNHALIINPTLEAAWASNTRSCRGWVLRMLR